jgi:hypothetical protein
MNKTLASNGQNRTASLASCQRDDKFVFNASGREGCMPDGLGGKQAMSCYTAHRTPSMIRNPRPEIACSSCAQWLAESSTLRITAEQQIYAGSIVTFKFSRAELELFPPSFGVAADSTTVQVLHSQDARKVLEREKYRSICSLKSIPTQEPTHRGCVRARSSTTFSSPTDARVSVRADQGALNQSVAFTLRLAAFDAQMTSLAPSQEPASPVMALQLEPGKEWLKPVTVAVPMSPAPLVRTRTYKCPYVPRIIPS